MRDSRSPTDRPEHFDHKNGATAFRAVWVATDAGADLERLLVTLGGTSTRRTAQAPDAVPAIVVSVDRGEVIILPKPHQVLPGRPVIGASLRVTDLQAVRRQLSAAGIPTRLDAGPERRIVVSPRDTHGLWLEFR